MPVEGDPAAGAGSGPKGDPGAGAGGGGDGPNDSSGNPPAIGSDQAGSGDGASSGGGGKPPAVGSDQCARSVGKRCGDTAPARQPTQQQENAWVSAKTDSAAAIKAQNDAVGNKNTPDSQLKDWTKAYKTQEDKPGALEDLFRKEGGGSPKYTSELKLNPSSNYRYLKFWSNDEAPNWMQDPGTRTVHEAYYGKADGAVIAKTSYAKADGTQGGNRMKWYEFAAKAWSDTPGGDTKQLKWIARDDVRGPESRDAIDAALIKSGKGNGPAKFAPNDPNFQALAGTDNGRGPFYLTGRFHNMLGDREVKFIHAWKDPDGKDFKYYMALEIGPK